MESEGIRQRNADAKAEFTPASEPTAGVERAKATPSHPAVQGWRMILIALYFLGSCMRYTYLLLFTSHNANAFQHTHDTMGRSAPIPLG
jgi:hypothetical protein